MDTLSKRHLIGDPVDPADPEPMPQPLGPPMPVPGTTPGPPPPRRPEPAPRFALATAILLLMCSGTAWAQPSESVGQPEAMTVLPYEVQRIATLKLPQLRSFDLMQHPGPWLPYTDSIADKLMLDNVEIDRTDVDKADKFEHQWLWEQLVNSISRGDQLPKGEKLRGSIQANEP